METIRPRERLTASVAAVVTAAWGQRSTVSEIIDLAVVWLVCGLKKPEDLTLILREQVPKNNYHLEKWVQQRVQLGAQLASLLG